MSDLDNIKFEKIEIMINGNKYRVEYDYNSYAMLEKRTGKTRKVLYERLLNDKLSAVEEIAVIYCSLVKHHNDFDEALIGQITNMHNVAPAVVMAFLKPLTPPAVFESLFFEESEKTKKKRKKGVIKKSNKRSGQKNL